MRIELLELRMPVFERSRNFKSLEKTNGLFLYRPSFYSKILFGELCQPATLPGRTTNFGNPAPPSRRAERPRPELPTSAGAATSNLKEITKC